MKDKSSGAWGLMALIGAIVLFFVLRRLLPSLARVLMIIGGIAVALLVILLAVVLYFAFKKPKQKGKAAGGEEVSAVLAKGRANLMEIRRRGMLVKNLQIRKRSEEICAVADKILRTLKEQPENIPNVRRFFNYYLPTLGSILQKYERLETSGVPASDVTESAIRCLGDIKTAMEKLYANLFDDDKLDLSVEMETLTQICKRDGLLAEETLPAQEGKKPITLTL